MRASAAAATPVSLTFDDLPTLAITAAPAYARETTRRLADGLTRRGVPAVGFVIGDRLRDRPALRRQLSRAWTRSRLELGNHTWSHGSPNTMAARDYIADIARNDALLRRMTRRPVRWFRPPYLETGPTEADRAAIQDWLAGHGYRLAPVTLENDDDLFAPAYDAAVIAHQPARARQIRRAYLRFSAARIRWYRQASAALLGRTPSQVLLLHATRLNADSLGGLLRVLRREDFTPTPLRGVLADPAYARGEGPASRDGDDWLNRWAAVVGHDLPWDSFPEAPAWIRAASARLDAD